MFIVNYNTKQAYNTDNMITIGVIGTELNCRMKGDSDYEDIHTYDTEDKATDALKDILSVISNNENALYEIR